MLNFFICNSCKALYLLTLNELKIFEKRIFMKFNFLKRDVRIRVKREVSFFLR